MLLGAHVSTAGGCRNAPARAAAIGATAIQVFTKQPNRWAEVEVVDDECSSFRAGVGEHGVVFANAHDSYLINLATADPVLRDRSYAAFVGELRRAERLGLHALVTHPGNATDGDLPRGLAQNAELIERALEEAGGSVTVLLETTAGSGKVIGSRFEELAEMIARVRPEIRGRVAVCVDTCHIFAAGYDLRGDYDGVINHLGDTVGLDRIHLFHLNDSATPFASRKDRHAGIGEGSLGEAPFRRLMTDARFVHVPKVLETPKGDDPKDMVSMDLANLARLRSYCADGEPAT
ncbi:deoxyribonuclease IV [Longimicrobium terrae]|uniref:Probable endonuclease 4 n=1 Tax=Longimicrobium terrae TaxID=1639882 RepID=A0A841GM63_9BACT|nr:deoxyribonuclease-4 [Longimicrobium terrae]MBB6068392.1 deoxyribonuclease-4 [Longimicrobium terrae]NNC32672.1 deoxyribonuclease IV [Longimicrobium terrae]